jgi:hypothetical protein
VDGYGRSGFPPETVFELGGLRIAVRHIVYRGDTLTPEGRAFVSSATRTGPRPIGSVLPYCSTVPKPWTNVPSSQWDIFQDVPRTALGTIRVPGVRR